MTMKGSTRVLRAIPRSPEPSRLARRRSGKAKLPGRAPVANVPPGPASGATSRALRRPGMTSKAMVPSAAAPLGGGRLHPLPARRTGTERAHRE